jgi:hypothetical protein
MSHDDRVELSPAEWRREKEKGSSKEKEFMKNDAEQRAAILSSDGAKGRKEHKR